MKFAKYDTKSIFKDIQRVELGESVKITKILRKFLIFVFFLKKHTFF